MIDLVPFNLSAEHEVNVIGLRKLHDFYNGRLTDGARQAAKSLRAKLFGVIVTFNNSDWYALALLAMDNCPVVVRHFQKGLREPSMRSLHSSFAGSISHVEAFAKSARGGDQQAWVKSTGFRVTADLAFGFMTTLGTVVHNADLQDEAFSDLDRRVRNMVVASAGSPLVTYEPYTPKKLAEDFAKLEAFQLRNTEGFAIC